MGKYLKEIIEEKKEMLLSEYLKLDESEFKCSFFREDARIKRTEYLMTVLGDVSFDEETYILFIRQFQCFGGRYDVRVREDTLMDIYEITRKYKMLTVKAIDEIWFRYIRDLFKDYDLMSVFEKYVEVFGQTDEAFEMFMDYVDKKADIHQQKYLEEAARTSELEGEYSEKFISHLETLIRFEHYSYDEIKKYLPSAELIKKDEAQISELATQTRIFFGCCQPVSYTMFDILLKEKTLDSCPLKVEYHISTGRSVLATFTKDKFLKSIQQQKVLKRKK